MFSREEQEELKIYIQEISKLNQEFNEIAWNDKNMIGRLLLEYPIEKSIEEYAKKNKEMLNTMEPKVIKEAIQAAKNSVEMMNGEEEYEIVSINIKKHITALVNLLECIEGLMKKYKVVN